MNNRRKATITVDVDFDYPDTDEGYANGVKAYILLEYEKSGIRPEDVHVLVEPWPDGVESVEELFQGVPLYTPKYDPDLRDQSR